MRRPPAWVFASIAVAAVTMATALRLWVELPINAIVEGLAYVTAGIAVWSIRPANRIGKLLTLYPFLIWTVHLERANIPILWTISRPLFYIAAFGILLYTALTFPRDRLSGWWEKGIFLLLVCNFFWTMAFHLFIDPRAMGCVTCPPGLNLALIRSDPELVASMVRIQPWWVLAVMLPAAILLITKFVRASKPLRRVLLPMLLPALAWLLVNRIAGMIVVFSDTDGPLGEPSPLLNVLSGIDQAAIIALPFAFLIGLWRLRARRERVGDMLAELEADGEVARETTEDQVRAATDETEAETVDRAVRRPPVWVFASIAVTAMAMAIALQLWVELPVDAIVEGLAFVIAGIAAWSIRPANRIGKLLTLYPFLIWTIHLGSTNIPILWTIGPLLFYIAAFGILLYTALSFPRGRLSGWWERGIMLLLAANFVWQIVIQLFIDPRALGCVPCPEGLNLLLIRSDPEVVAFMAGFNPWWLTAVMVPAAVLLVIRFARASTPQRRVLLPMLIPALAWLLANRTSGLAQVFVSSPGELFSPQSTLLVVLGRIEQGAIILLPFSFLLGLLRLRARRARVGDMVQELEQLEEPAAEPAALPGRVQEALARTLGDPSIEVGYWDRDLSRYSTVDGRVLELPEESTTRAAAFLERAGQPLAVILHDPALLEDRRMLDAAAAAARLAIENERLQAEVRAQLTEVRASRARIVAAGDAERKRVERNLHDGAQQRLLTLSLQLRMLEERLGEAADPALKAMVINAEAEASSALEEVRELAQGVHPSILTDEGLGPAIEYLAERSPVPVEASVTTGRFPEQIEATAYFVVAEALANVAKYAAASRVDVRVLAENGHLHVEVTDDGAGGADPSKGSGLRGLDDRVAAVDGRLDVKSAQGAGTTLLAELPIPPP